MASAIALTHPDTCEDSHTQGEEKLIPLLSHYDPYHNTVVALPGPWGPAALLPAARPPPPPCLHYQDFAPTFTGYEEGNLMCVQQYR